VRAYGEGARGALWACVVRSVGLMSRPGGVGSWGGVGGGACGPRAAAAGRVAAHLPGRRGGAVARGEGGVGVGGLCFGAGRGVLRVPAGPGCVGGGCYPLWPGAMSGGVVGSELGLFPAGGLPRGGSLLAALSGGVKWEWCACDSSLWTLRRVRG